MAFVPRSGRPGSAIREPVGRSAREVLNELRWREPRRLEDAVLWYRDRTRPEGHRVIRGSEIVDLERRYFATKNARLPYYRIERIEGNGEILFQR
jgi:uncharacterized protein (UPF0248 family)